MPVQHVVHQIGDGKDQEQNGGEVVIGKQGAANGQPGQELRENGDEDEQSPSTLAADGLDEHGEEGQQARPGHQGIVKGGKQTLDPLGVGQIQVPIVQNGPGVKNPLVPAGLVGVGGVDALVVGEHELLVAPHHIQQVVQGEIALGSGVGDVGGGVDHRGQEHKEDDGQGGGAQHEADEVEALGVQLPLPVPKHQAQQPHHGQTGPGVDHRPLAGAADAPEQSAQEQGHGGFPQGRAHGAAQPAVHKVVGHQDEEHPVGVYGADTRLYQVHEVKGEETGAAEGHRGLAKEVFQEHIEDGQHEHPEQGPHKPPAKGHHAEEGDAKGHDELAQGRVGDLIGVDVVQVLQGGAGVVDFVKVGGVHIGLLGGPLLWLVKQGLGPHVHMVGDERLAVTPQGQLGQPHAFCPVSGGGGDAEGGGLQGHRGHVHALGNLV